MTVDFLTLPDRRLAYQRFIGGKDRPGVVFFGGYASDMTGTKATFLDARCRASNLPFLRFDYRGCGQSGGDFKACTLGDWLADAFAVLEQLTEGPQILIGSSMGGWLALQMTLKNPVRVEALIGIAAAPDFTEDLLWARLSPDQRAQVQRDGFITDAGLPVSWHVIEEARRHLLLRAPIAMTCPVRLLQGMKDTEVPWGHALRTAERIAGEDVRVTLIKDGDHRLSRDQDLAALWKVVEEFT